MGFQRRWLMARIVDLRQYVEVLDPFDSARVPPQAKRIAEFFAAIVQGVTGGWTIRRMSAP